MTDPDGDGVAASDGPLDQPTTPLARRLPRRRRTLIAAVVVLGALVAVLAWLGYTGLRARTELEAARAQIATLRSQLQAGDLAAARTTATALRHHADAAHDLTSGPVWSLAAGVPWAGAPMRTTRTLTAAVAAVADDALPRLVDASTSLDPVRLRRPDGTIDLAPITAAAPQLQAARTVLTRAIASVRSSASSTWLGGVDGARADVLAKLDTVAGAVGNADIAAEVLPPMLGADGPRTYLVAFQNEAELRGLGGLPGAFGILRADRGRFRFTRFEPDDTLDGVRSGLHFGADYDRLWTGGPTALYVNSTASPHFPYAARIWTAMWRRKTGQRLDGAITLDPTTLSYLLEVSGPAFLTDGTRVDSSNVVDLTQRTVYSRFAKDNAARKTFLLDIARAVSDKLIHGALPDPAALVSAAGRAAGEHRLLVWTRHAATERVIAPTPISGVVPTDASPYAGLGIVNNGGNKLDYYLRADLDRTRTSCGTTDEVSATITLTNTAPSRGLPAYVVGYGGRPGFPRTPGVDRVTVYYFASVGATLRDASADGRPTGVVSGVQQGHLVVARTFDLPLGEPQHLLLRLTEPSAPGAPTVRVQPMVTPVRTTVRDACAA